MARVLIVEDETSLRKLAALFFKEAGHEVTSCANCTEAVAELKKQPPFDFLMDDWNNPGLGEKPNPLSGGRELLQYIKQHPEQAPHDIAIMSGNRDAAATGVILSAFEPPPPVFFKPELFATKFKTILAQLKP